MPTDGFPFPVEIGGNKDSFRVSSGSFQSRDGLLGAIVSGDIAAIDGDSSLDLTPGSCLHRWPVGEGAPPRL